MSTENNEHEGIFLVEGAQLNLGNLSFSINEKGEIASSSPEIRLRYDVCPEWLEIAFEHLQSNDIASQKIQESRQQGDDQAIGKALKQECRYGMQSIVASCTAMDAFFEATKDLTDIPSEVFKAWGKNRTAKYAKTAETIKMAFGISNESANKIRDFLKEAYSYRDRAIHPIQEFTNPAVHPELKKAVDFKFVLFRHHNAKAILQMTLSFIHQLVTFDKIKNENIQKYADQLLVKVQPLVDNWRTKYDKLHEKS